MRGSIVPMVTPFRQGKLDEHALTDLIEWQIQSGSHGISVTGTTGEPSSLSRDERMRVIELASQVINQRVPFVAGTGSNNFDETLALSKFAEHLGVDAVMLIAPYYVRPSQEGLFQFFKQIASQLSISVILYNIPGRTAVNIEPDTVARLKDACPNIIGCKESNKDFEHINRLLHKMGRDFLVYSGIELLCFPVLAIGGAGYISATGNLLPKKVADVYNLTQQGKWEEARKLHFELLPLNDAIFLEINPVPVKTVLGWMGKISPEVRLPLAPLSQANHDRLRAIVKQYDLIT